MSRIINCMVCGNPVVFRPLTRIVVMTDGDEDAKETRVLYMCPVCGTIRARPGGDKW